MYELHECATRIDYITALNVQTNRGSIQYGIKVGPVLETTIEENCGVPYSNFVPII